MTAPRRPRDYATEPDDFGVKSGAKFTGWVNVHTVTDLAGLRAAEVQHAWALVARKAVRGTGLDDSEFERAAGLGQRRLGKLFHGHTRTTLVDVFAVEAVVGPILLNLRFTWWPVHDTELASRFTRAQSLFRNIGDGPAEADSDAEADRAYRQLGG